MVNNFEDFSVDKSPFSDDWDMSDVDNPFNDSEKNVDKSEEERNYNLRENALKDELQLVVSKRANYIFNAGDEFSTMMRCMEHPLSKRIEGNFDDLVTSKKKNSNDTLESFFTYIDSVYPSPYKNAENLHADEAEDEYRRTAMSEGQNTGDNLDEIATTFSIDGSDRDLHIATVLKNMGQDSADYQAALSRAIIAYSENPSQENRSRLTRIQSDHSGALANSLFNIAETFDSSRTELGKKMFDPTVELATMLARSSEEYFEGLMGYMKFKMENSSVKKAEIPSENTSNQILPDVFLQ